jgi:transcriptional regulator with XRE-family HTH domain
MRKVTPDGKRIKELRLQNGLPQKTIAGKANVSERLLREVENRNRVIDVEKAVDLATALGVPLEDIALKPSVPMVLKSDETVKDANPYSLRINVVRFGNDLWTQARGCDSLTWAFVCKPTVVTAPLMEEVLKLVSRIMIRRPSHDEYDEYDREYAYPDLYRVARLNQIVDDLAAENVCIHSNTYLYNYLREIDDGKTEVFRLTKIYVQFCNLGTEQSSVYIDPGFLQTPSWEYTGGDLDDEIPF